MAIILGSTSNNQLTGTASGDVILAAGGNDKVNAGAGNDLVDGGTGNDTIDGSSGNDTLIGGAGNDTLIDNFGVNLVFGGSGNDAIRLGSSQGSVVYGDGFDGLSLISSFFFGPAASLGNDTIGSGAGDDLIFGDSGVNLNGSAVGGNDDIDGGAGNDQLFGEGGNDTLGGGDGHDRLIGGSGADMLRGGAGNDGFVYKNTFESTALSMDRIADFAIGQDKIDLSAMLTGGLAWGGATAATNGVWVTQSGGNTFVRANVNGNTDFVLQLTGLRNLSESDFLGVASTANQAPTLTGDPALLSAGAEDSTYMILASALLQGYTDPNGDTLVVSGLTATSGVLVVTATGWTFTPSSNYNGAVNLSYNVVDGNGGSVAASRSFSLVAVNDVVTGSATAALPNGTEDTAYEVTGAQLLQGFSDVDIATNGQVLSISGAVTASNGSVSHDTGTDIYTITPAANYAGPVQLNYQVADGNGGYIAATQHFNLLAVDAPNLVLVDPAGSVGGTAIGLSIQVALTDTDGSASLGDVVISGVPTGWALSAGVLTNDETGAYALNVAQLAGLTITPAAGASGTINLTVTATSIESSNGVSSSSSSSIKVSVSQPNLASGQAIDGYIAGATVFADANASGVLDGGEAHATTDASGNFTLVSGTGNLVMYGGIDVSTGAAFVGTLRAPEWSTVITPLTTLVAALVAQGQSVVAAEANVGAALGLEPTINLLTFDPIALVAAGGSGASDAAKVLAAGIQVQNAIVQIGSLLTGAGATDAGAAVVTALASQLSAGSPVDLSNEATTTALMNAAATAALSVEPTDISAVVADAAAVLAAANASINTALSGSGIALLEDLAQVAVVAQGADVSASLAAVGASNNGSESTALATSYTGSSLTTLVSGASVGDVTGGINGTLGDDVLSGTSANNAMAGLGGNDLLIGLGGNDTLLGGVGNDSLRGGAGDDVLNGGFIAQYLTASDWSDIDRADYSDATQQVVVNLATGTANGTEIGTDQLIGIEEVAGGSGNDSLTGSDSFFESFIGGAGDDTIKGEGGNDRAVYAAATAAISANLGSGNVNAPSAGGSVIGDLSVGTDTLLDVEQIRGTSYGDTFVAAGFASLTQPGGVSSTFNSFEGLGGNDTITGNGNTRADYVSASGAVTVNLVETSLAYGGSSGNATGAGVGTDTLLGGINNVRGSVHADTFTGGSATSSQSWEGRGEADLIDGGSGFDTARYGFDGPISVGLTINMAAGTVAGDPLYTGVDTLRNVEGIQGSILGDVYDARGYGAVGAINVSSGFGTFGTFNSFEGMNGNDTIYGNGDTQIEFFNAREGVAVDLAAGSVVGGASVGNDTIIGGGVLRVIGSAFDDVIKGVNNSGPSTVNTVFEIFQGRGGNDIIDSNGGFDQVRYNEGAQATHVFSPSLLALAPTLNGIYLSVKGASTVDATTFIVVGNPVTVGTDELINMSQIRGSVLSDFFDARGYSPDTGFGNGIFVEFQGDGGDDYYWGNGNTRVSYSAAGSAVTVTLTNGGAGTASGASTGEDTFLGGVDLVRGSDFNDLLIGSSTGNSFQGRAGNDTIRGGGGDDRIEGQGGTDLIDFSDATAAISFTLNQGSNGGNLWSTGALAGGLGTDSYRDMEGVIGSAFNDALTGSSGNDALYGGDGNDNLVGGLGNDSLYGGLGSEFLQGEAGNDLYDGGPVVEAIIGLDVNGISYRNAPSAVNVNLQTGEVLSDGYGGSDTLLNIDFVTGSSGDDTLTGSTGGRFENFEGRQGRDTINGGVISDTLNEVDTNRVTYQNDPDPVTIDLAAETAVSTTWGTDRLLHINQVRGSNFDDFIYGSNRTDVSESFEGRAGVDHLDGRGGFDTARYNYTSSSVTVNLVVGKGFVGTALGTAWDEAAFQAALDRDFLYNIEAVNGSFGNDTLIGGNPVNDALEVFRAQGGNDYIDGGSGYDRVDYNIASEGVVVTLGGTGAGSAADGIRVLNGVQVLSGGATGIDTLWNIEAVRGSSSDDELNGSDIATLESFEGRDGNDIIDGNGGIDRASYFLATSGVVATLGLAGADGSAADGYGFTDILRDIENLEGSRDFHDSLTGNELANTLAGLGGNDILSGGSGFDTADYSAASGSVQVDLTANLATGADGNDQLSGIEGVIGSAYNDNLTGNELANTLAGRGGNDILSGGSGFDTADYSAASGSVQVDLSANLATGADGNDQLSGIEGVIGSAYNDNLTGNGNANALVGGAGDDFLIGGDGDDTLNGGANSATSASGGDTADYLSTNQSTGITVTLAGGSGTVTGGGGVDTLIGIEHINGTNLDDTITGDAGINFLEGNGGDDSIYGGAGDDFIRGAAGADSLEGGDGFDQLSYTFASGGVDVNLGNGSVSGADGNDTVVGFEMVSGSRFDDTLTGGAGDEHLRGRAGDDIIDGGAGFDRVRYDQASGAVTVNLAFNIGFGTSAGADGNDTLYNIEHVRGSNFGDTLIGNAIANNLQGLNGNDTLYGGAGNDNLQGENGDDVLFGQEGADNMSGGAGNDTLDGGVVVDWYFGTDMNFVSYNGATAGVNVDLSGVSGDGSTGSGTVAGNASVGNDVLVNINLIQGSGHGDTMMGSTAAIYEQFEGGAGDDIIDGGLITDTLNGVNHNRLMYQNTTGAGVMVDLAAGTADGAIGSNAGHDSISNINSVRGSDFADSLYGSDRTDILFEEFEGRGGDDTIDGRGGEDRARYDSASGAVNANLVTRVAEGIGGDSGIGRDTLLGIEQLSGGAYDDILTGGYAANGTSIADYFNAGLKESFRGNAGDDIIDGGQGMDFVIYGNAAAGVTVVLNDTVDGWADDGQGGIDELRGIEGVVGSLHNDTLTGSDSGAFESFAGQDGSNLIDGMGGRDRVDYYQARGGVQVTLGIGTADGYGVKPYDDFQVDTLRNIEDVRGSRDTGDNIYGNEADNLLEGLGGNDSIRGGGGNDTIDGGDGIDVLFFFDAGYAVSINLDDDGLADSNGYWTATGSLEYWSGTVSVDFTLHYRNIEWVMGSSAGDTIGGSGGNDVLDGSRGADVLRGGAGDDIIIGGEGIDLIDFSDATAAIDFTLYSNGAYRPDIWNFGYYFEGGALAGIGTDYYSGIDGVIGSAFNDTIVGGIGGEVLNGGGGNDELNGGIEVDTLIGGTGDDTLVGGAGPDTFIWNQGDGGAVGAPATDTIADFLTESDLVDLSGLLVGESHDGTDPGNLLEYLEFSNSGGNTTISVDSDGIANDYGVDQIITLVGYAAGGTDSASILQSMLNSGYLFTD